MTTIDLNAYMQRIQQEMLALRERLAYLNGQSDLLQEMASAAQETTDEALDSDTAAASSNPDDEPGE